MPNIKLTDLINLLDRQITELKEGDPAWTKEQKKKAKDTIEMMRAFRTLSEQTCGDTVQGIPGPSGAAPAAAAPKKKSSRKR